MIAYAWWRREVGLRIKVKPQWQHYVRELHPDFNFMKNPQLAGFHRTLNGEMKRLCSVGLGAKRRQAEPIPVSEENVPRKKGLLGCTTPRVLVDTMVFLCGLYFALGSSQEHRSLTFDQLELFEPYNGPAYLSYIENASKNNTGGLVQRKVQSKQVIPYSGKFSLGANFRDFRWQTCFRENKNRKKMH